MYLEVFCRVLPLLVETCGRLLIPLEKSSSSSNHFIEKRKRLLAAAKTLISGGYLTLTKTCVI